jgi:hypothetical protein
MAMSLSNRLFSSAAAVHAHAKERALRVQARNRWADAVRFVLAPILAGILLI